MARSEPHNYLPELLRSADDIRLRFADAARYAAEGHRPAN
jgi:hypothetical protein